jgi:hypothetical protein
MTIRLIPECRNPLTAAPAKLHTRPKAADGRNFHLAQIMVQPRITVHLLIMVQVQEFPLLIGLTMHRRAILAETAGLRLICIGLL